MNFDNNRNPNQGEEFEVDVDNMQVLQNNQNSIMNESHMQNNNTQNMNNEAVLASNDDPNPPKEEESGSRPQVINQEDDGNGFFITGINTEDQNQVKGDGFEQIDEE